ncbi:hypothetical protein COCOBI_16-2090 [Coccomyxa sp. Obi]|nr:hypothetical protein COCOBI_16-2090 [Coccomyxa sp. Obi]
MSDVPASTGYTGAGATVINDGIDRSAPSNVIDSHLHGGHGNAPTIGVQPGSVPATAGYSGGGATATATPDQLSHRHGINTGKEYQGSATSFQPKNTCEGIHAAHGGAGGPCDHHDDPHQVAGSQAPTGSTLGAGPDAPVNVVPIAGQTMPENPTAQDKAKMKTAATVAGVQEDLKGLRDRLTATQGGQAGAQTDAPTRGERAPVYVSDQQAQTEAGASGKPGMMDKVKGFAVKTIDHTQAALEGAKQKVTKQTTQPASTAPES